MCNIEIRAQRIGEEKQIYQVVQAAFASAEQRDGNEQDLVDALQKSNAFIPALSLVAVIDQKIVGYVLFTKAVVGDNEELVLAPLAVLPQFQRQGIGCALIQEGHRIAKDLGFHYSIVLGSDKYYSKFGYRPASSYGICAPFAVEDQHFMAFPLQGYIVDVKGTVIYAPEFDIGNDIP